MSERPTETYERRASLADRDPDELAALLEELTPDDDAAAGECAAADMAERIVASMPDEDLESLPEVAALRDDPAVELRPGRADLEAAALGQMLEAEREAAARALCEAENEAARSIDANDRAR